MQSKKLGGTGKKEKDLPDRTTFASKALNPEILDFLFF